MAGNQHGVGGGVLKMKVEGLVGQIDPKARAEQRAWMPAHLEQATGLWGSSQLWQSTERQTSPPSRNNH